MSDETKPNEEQTQEESKQHKVDAERVSQSAEEGLPYPDTVFDPEALSKDAKTMAMLVHITTLVSPIIIPLIIWLIKREDEPFVDDQGKESLNFQISVFIAGIVLTCTCIGIALLPVLGIGALVFTIIAGLAANDGKTYRYPYTFRFFK